MNGMIAWFARNHVAANLVMVGIFVLGGLSTCSIKRELVPSPVLDLVRVTVPYPGATPSEVEDGIVLRIEEAVADLDGIEELSATATEGVGSVVLEVADGYNVRELLDDVKSRVDGITTFPVDAEEPQVEAPTIRRRVIGLSLTGSLPEGELRTVGERVRDDLLDLPEITQVELAAVRDYEISVEVSEAALRQYGLTFDEVVRAVRASSLDLPAGAIKQRTGEILLRTVGQARTGSEFDQVVLRSQADGTTVLLGDVARVVDGFADQDIAAQVGGMPALHVQVFRVGEQDILALSAAVREYVDGAAGRLPPGIELQIWDDTSVLFRDRMDTLTSNAVMGLLLVFLALALFLDVRLSLWVTIGIPISFLGALWVMPMADASFNMISMFALILVLGIVVDDAIVVGEGIHAQQERGMPGQAGAIAGAQRVARPVVFAVLTSIIAFAPMLFISGVDGRFWRLIPIVVIACLAFSLVESLLVLPAHLSGQPDENRKPPLLLRPLVWVQRGIAAGLSWVIRAIYAPILRFALRWRYATMAVFLGMLIMTVGLFASGMLRVAFFPAIASDAISVSLELPVGSPFERTQAKLDQVGVAVEQLRADYDTGTDLPLIGQLYLTAGGTPISSGMSGPGGGGGGGSGAHVGEAYLALTNVRERGISANDVKDRWREIVGELAGVRRIEYKAELGSRGAGITVELVGRDIEALRAATTSLRAELAQFGAVYGIRDNLSDGKQELILGLTPTGVAAGLRLEDLARQVRQAFFGAEAQRVLRGRDEIKVMIRLPEQQRQSIDDLSALRIRTADGTEVPFASVATLSRRVGPPAITRSDRRRTVTVEAEIDPAIPDSSAITDRLPALFEALAIVHPEVEMRAGGGNERQAKVGQELGGGMLIALLAMFSLMAIAFRSYLQPLIVMAAIPFGWAGAIWAHFFLGMEFSMLSFLGMVALAGVVVNDSLVMVDAINHHRDQGKPLFEAVVAGGRERFRAVLLTTLTTFLGLAPLMLETSVQAQFLIPMAVALAFGVVGATAITLALVPCLYLIQADAVRALRWIFLRHEVRHPLAVPAVDAGTTAATTPVGTTTGDADTQAALELAVGQRPRRRWWWSRRRPE